MIAVSNTTPLRYLIAIGQGNLLGQLFERVFIPNAVLEELTEAGTPENVRRRVLSRPAWLEVRTVHDRSDVVFPATLHRGEREAILLAEEQHPDAVLIDDQIGRNIALSRNLPLSGTLGVLERADAIGILPNFSVVLVQLKASGFFISDRLEKLLLRRHQTRGERKIPGTNF
jgi:predicted nucleic acid-binding protein